MSFDSERKAFWGIFSLTYEFLCLVLDARRIKINGIKKVYDTLISEFFSPKHVLF